MKPIGIKTYLRRVALLAIAGFFSLQVAGCGEERGTPKAVTTSSTVTATTFSAVLNGAQEVPPVVSTASGTATVTVDAARTTINVTLNTAGVVNATASHIHFGVVGMSGGVLFSLFISPGVFPATLTKTLTSADFTPDAVNGIITFADAVNAILAGNAYINVHTLANPSGEIRGQVTL